MIYEVIIRTTLGRGPDNRWRYWNTFIEVEDGAVHESEAVHEMLRGLVREQCSPGTRLQRVWFYTARPMEFLARGDRTGTLQSVNVMDDTMPADERLVLP